MKAILDFFQTLGLAEILITIALVLICVIAWYDCKFTDKKLDEDIKRFNEKYRKH